MTLLPKATRMRHVFLVIPALVAAACFSSTAQAETTPVKVGDNYFVRAGGVPTVTVERNDTVRFVFAGRSPHNVIVERGPVKFRSSTMSSGSYSKKMTTSGSYLLVCSIHGKRDMSMKLVVERP